MTIVITKHLIFLAHSSVSESVVVVVVVVFGRFYTFIVFFELFRDLKSVLNRIQVCRLVVQEIRVQ